MTSNHFGWSLSDTVDDPRRTGLANFRHKLLLHQHTSKHSSVDVVDDELTTSAEAMRHRCVSEETLAADSSAPIGRPVKPYYRREPSVSQCSDSCFGSEYPSLTSTGTPFLYFCFQKYFVIQSNVFFSIRFWLLQDGRRRNRHCQTVSIGSKQSFAMCKKGRYLPLMCRRCTFLFWFAYIEKKKKVTYTSDDR